MSADKKKLEAGYAKVRGHQQALQGAREKLVQRAREQLDSMIPVVEAWEKKVEQGTAGLHGQRRLKTLLQERDRLLRIVHAAD